MKLHIICFLLYTSGGYTYNGLIDPASVKGVWDLYHDKEINKDLLLAYGNGDGGGGVNRDMLEMGRHLKAMPGLPEVIPGTAYDYFENLQKTIASTDRHVPTWDGELYLEMCISDRSCSLICSFALSMMKSGSPSLEEMANALLFPGTPIRRR